MNENRKATEIWLITAVCFALVGIISSSVLAVAFIKSSKENQTAQTQSYALENYMRSSFYGLADAMNNIEVNLGKTALSSSKEIRHELLVKLTLQGEAAESYASLIPFYREDVSRTVKFINQVTDYSKSLLKKLNSGKDLTEEDLAVITEMKKTANLLSGNINKTLESLDGVSLSKAFGQSDGFSMSGSFSSEEKQETFEYPRLIYDGPFSDGKDLTDKSKLSGETYSVSRLKDKISELLADYSVNEVVYKTSFLAKSALTHSFSVSTDKGNFEINATSTGGYIVQMNGYSEREEVTEVLGKDECVLVAEEFARKAGYDVKAVWVSKSIEGYVYVNLCPAVNGIIIYPNLVKVTVDTVKGVVVGIEGSSYVFNHTRRDLTLSEDKTREAVKRLSESLTVKETKIALIPKNDAEILCYEFRCVNDNEEYFVYINCATLEEENILKVIKGTEGYTVI